MKFAAAHAKAIYGFVSAEAATFVTVLSMPESPSLRTYLVAALTPLAAGAVVHQVKNTPPAAGD